MSIFKHHEDHLSPSLRRTAVGLTGVQKRVFSDGRKILGGGGKLKPLCSLRWRQFWQHCYPAAGAQAQTSTSCPSITGEVTGTITVEANQECTLESSGRINVDTAGNAAFDITGAGSKVISYGNINLRANDGAAFQLSEDADNVVIEFLSGSVNAGLLVGRNFMVFSEGANTKLIFGGTALIAGLYSSFFFDGSRTDNEIILLPGAVIHSGDRSRPFAGSRSLLENTHQNEGSEVLKIGNFHDGIPPRTGWVHAGQWFFGEAGGGTDELIVDTNPGVRFSISNGRNHFRSNQNIRNAIFGLDTMDIRSGNVVLGGSVYMPDGKVYIHDAGRLTFEIGKRRDDGRIGEMIISRLVADEVIFTGDDPRVFIQFAHYLDASDIEKFRKQLVTTEFKKLSDRTRVSDGEDNRLSKIFVVDDVFFLDKRQCFLRVAVC